MNKTTKIAKAERGATAIIVGIMMVVLIGLAALAIDVGYAMVTRNELQNVADGAALAATRQLGENYKGMSANAMQNYVAAPGPIRNVAKDVAIKNSAGGTNININNADIIIGKWDADSKILTETLQHPDAVRVTARRDGSANGSITTFFARIFGRNTVDITATATAAITGQSTINKCDLIIPVGISTKWYEDGNCGQPIRFYPTGNMTGCAGWHVFEDWPASASKLRDILEEKKLRNCSGDDEYNINDDLYFTFTGGTVASAFDEMQALFEEYAVDSDDDGVKDWTTLLAVYDYEDCSNPKGSIKIVGLCTVTITEVSGPGGKGGKTIWGNVQCDQVDTGRGGAELYGTMGSIPGLVQ